MVSKGDKNNIVHPNKQQPSSNKQQDVTDLQALQHLLGQGIAFEGKEGIAFEVVK